MTKFGIFSDPARKLSALTPETRQNIVILKKNLLSTDSCSTRVLRLVNLGLQILEIHASYIEIIKKLMTWVNSLGHVLFPFARWQHDHVQTPLPCETTMTQPVARGRADCMCLAPVRCRVLLYSVLPTNDACSSSSLSTTVINAASSHLLDY